MGSRYKDEDIERLQREERARPSPPHDQDKIRERQELKSAMREALRNMSWRDFEKALSELGVQPGTPEHAQYQLIWRQYQQQRLSEKKP